jgi:hypothetical protein
VSQQLGNGARTNRRLSRAGEWMDEQLSKQHGAWGNTSWQLFKIGVSPQSCNAMLNYITRSVWAL